MGLHGLVVIGGDDSNTNAAMLAEYFKAQGSSIRVVGCPKTIDGDLKNDHIETSFGFDTAVKTFSELIGNLALDGSSSKKYWNFVRLMGRSASHITLECALQTCPNITLIGEEVAAKGSSLIDLTMEMCDVIQKRSEQGMDYGVVLLPEGLVEFMPEVHALIEELNELLAKEEEEEQQQHQHQHSTTSTSTTPSTPVGRAPPASPSLQSPSVRSQSIADRLSAKSAQVFRFLPQSIRSQLLLERDPHGNVQVSRIETEKLFMMLCATEMQKRRRSGVFKGKFASLGHFFGYEGRAGLPSKFDSDYCYALGYTAGVLIQRGFTGYMANVRDLIKPASEWKVGGAPLTMMMNIERRHGKDKPVIKKALVELAEQPFQALVGMREYWKYHDCYRNPGPIQFTGPTSELTNFTLLYTHKCGLFPLHSVNTPTRGATISQSAFANNEYTSAKDVVNYSHLQVQRLSAVPIIPQAFRTGHRPELRVAAAGALQVDSDIAQQYRRISNQDPTEFVVPHNVHQPAVRGPTPNTHDASGTVTATVVERRKQSVDGDSEPLRIGFVFCGRQTPGGHNALWGAVKHLSEYHPDSRVLGFAGGTHALFKGEAVELTLDDILPFCNQGGFDALCRTADMIRSPEQLEQAANTCRQLRLDGLLLVGGCTTSGDAAILSEHFLAHDVSTRVVVVPGTVDGDLKNDFIETCYGFDTAAKLFAQVVGNIQSDCNSAKKYWYFIRLMGRSHSHLTLECALQTHPNAVLIGEEILSKRQSLSDVTNELCDLIDARSQLGKDYGVVLIPEGLINLFPEFELLITELEKFKCHTEESVDEKLPPYLSALFRSLPLSIRSQLLMTRESDGSVQYSNIETEKLLVSMISQELARRKKAGQYQGKFSALTHFFGYQARCGLPTRFDSDLAYVLGVTATELVIAQQTGVVAYARNLLDDPTEWTTGGLPLAHVMSSDNPAKLVPSAEVDLHGKPFQLLKSKRQAWRLAEKYRNPGPVQFMGSASDTRPLTLDVERTYRHDVLKAVQHKLDTIFSLCSSGSDEVVQAADIGLDSVLKILSVMRGQHR
eukprot:TRINITY_DN1378_c0_g2_i1.p1 TRINITY_DN1378_c0_g2~~TRINITY_DN1378_c0_g2_i1.p1  ORF type:complete len:1178 (+),score=281.30 TRINITY_DN1378_c0_g2_i1:352-3534(+)